MKLPYATPSPSRRPSEAGSHVGGPDAEVPEHPWGLVLSQFATVARHDPRCEVCYADLLSTLRLEDPRCTLSTAFALHIHSVMNHTEHVRSIDETMPVFHLTSPESHNLKSFVRLLGTPEQSFVANCKKRIKAACVALTH